MKLPPESNALRRSGGMTGLTFGELRQNLSNANSACSKRACSCASNPAIKSYGADARLGARSRKGGRAEHWSAVDHQVLSGKRSRQRSRVLRAIGSSHRREVLSPRSSRAVGSGRGRHGILAPAAIEWRCLRRRHRRSNRRLRSGDGGRFSRPSVCSSAARA